MKSSKTLIILLVIPFAIALLSFISVIVLNNTVAADISGINWEYQANVGFKISDEPYKLKAEAEIDESLVIAPGNELTWFLRNVDNSDNEYAKIEQKGQDYYLYALNEGKVEVVCQNVRGTVSKYFTATIYENGTIIVNTKQPRSDANVDKNIYFGQYDLSYSSLTLDGATNKEAQIELVPTLLGGSGEEEIYCTSKTTNAITSGHTVIVKDSGHVVIDFFTTGVNSMFGSFEFEVIKDGYNIYSYNDMLMCTNFSSEGKTMVLQTNFESLKNMYVVENGIYQNTIISGKENNALFGNFNFSTQRFSFRDEITYIPSTYNTKFIEQYNNANNTNATKDITVGLHVKKDIYGNGFTINAHGLTYPTHGTYNEAGKLVPTRGEDYFYGPLAFVTIGNLEQMPVVKAYGQDNALIYLDGSNLTINDVKVRNTNEIDNMYNLIYSGSVIDVNGHNNTIKNSILSNGRNIVRAFCADGLTIDNCILKNAAQFLLTLGSNEYTAYDTEQTVKASYNGKTYSDTFDNFYAQDNKEKGAIGILDQIFNAPKMTNQNDISNALSSLNQIQSGLDNVAPLKDEEGNTIYNDEINVSRTYFSNSGIFSIAFETMFNGAFLYNGLMPNSLVGLVSVFGAIMPNKIGGTSSPVKLNLDKTSKFYDWKDVDKLDVSIMIEENISAMIKILAGKDIPLSMEDFFPLRSYLKDICKQQGYFYEDEGKYYLNTKVVSYGGGKNYSTVSIPEEDIEFMDLSKQISINLTEGVLAGKYISTIHEYVLLLSKCVSLAIGFNPFNFLTNGKTSNYTPEEFKKVPQIEDLQRNISLEEN